MRQIEALEALSRLASADTEDPVGATAEATRIVGAVIGSDDVRLFIGDGVTFEAYPPREEEDYFGFAPAGRMEASKELRALRRPAVYGATPGGLVADLAPADGKRGGEFVGLALWNGGTYSGTVVARGPWTGSAARRASRFLQPAAPALAIVLDRVSDAHRRARIERQMEALSNVAHVFTRSKNMRDVLQDVANAINGVTGLLCSIDVLDSRGRIIMRSAGVSRYAGTPLHKLWLNMTKAPDLVRDSILRDRQPVILPHLQTDTRISEEAREFYKRTSIVSGATFPLMFQDEVVGLLRAGSLKPTSFESPMIELLHDFAVQVAVVVKGVQLWEELQQSRKETERYAAKLQTSMEIEHHLARIDHLCGIPNRRYLDEIVAAECARAARYGSGLCLAMADLDRFKNVNDTYGHDAGDAVLRQVADIARSNCRKGDIVGRLGGDEFLFVLPVVDLSGAVASAERFRHTLQTTPLVAGSCDDLHITVSLGVAEADPESLSDPKLFTRHCDKCLYEAKAAGRNTVTCYRPPVARAV